MKVSCKYNKGADLRQFEYAPLEKERMGRFCAFYDSEYNVVKVGKEYLVMGIFIHQTFQTYLVDDNNFLVAYPCQLFEIADSHLPFNWQFRLVEKDEDIYPFIQAIIGYPELCEDKKAYEDLVVEQEAKAKEIYFKRKFEIINNAAEQPTK